MRFKNEGTQDGSQTACRVKLGKLGEMVTTWIRQRQVGGWLISIKRVQFWAADRQRVKSLNARIRVEITRKDGLSDWGDRDA
jgi:hypothetical protein